MDLQNSGYSKYVLEHMKKGTTTCALACSDGVVLAADTRASAGFFIADRHVMKIQKVDRHLGMTIAGGVALTLKIWSISCGTMPIYLEFRTEN